MPKMGKQCADLDRSIQKEINMVRVKETRVLVAQVHILRAENKRLQEELNKLRELKKPDEINDYFANLPKRPADAEPLPF